MIINICHLYGNLLNTYGDVGNVMALKYFAEKKGHQVNLDVISLDDKFDPYKYDFVFFGGGQDYEQSIVEKDLENKKENIKKYIENDGLFLAICGGFQLMGQYYYDAYNKKIEGLKIFDYYTKNQEDGNRFVGNIEIKDLTNGEIYQGFENHGGVTYLKDKNQAFASVISGNGNNGEDSTEGFRYKNAFASYLHGPLLARNENLANTFIEIIENRKR
ncbi:type 1 glutamine amidotransferase [Anaerococcus rubeinfantis]|uniref:type 1 glutamine amidotransferase n=1 Tax=Anaerococcus rubeinfantis TaxID=1720199 RepID=UPI00073E3348|nr:adenosylcobyric acid synthase [Anaerococcus rubeinfantis]